MKIALICSIILQFIAAGFGLGLIRKTKYNISWVLISIAFLLMAFRRIIDLVPYLDREYKVEMEIMSKWFGVLNSILLVVAAFYIRKIFEFIERINQLRSKSEKRVINAIVRTEEKERRRFAKELHDGLGPLLSSFKMSVSALKSSSDPVMNEKITNNLSVVVNEAIVSLKEISNNLSPHILENFGLSSAISAFTDKINALKGLQINYESNINGVRFKTNFETIVYRIVCELITNTIRHANADTVKLNAEIDDHLLRIIYKDDGEGFDTHTVLNEENTGMGYSNIFSRLKTLNGFILLNSEPNHGVNIQISVPLDNMMK